MSILAKLRQLAFVGAKPAPAKVFVGYSFTCTVKGYLNSPREQGFGAADVTLNDGYNTHSLEAVPPTLEKKLVKEGHFNPKVTVHFIQQIPCEKSS